ncbi:HAD family hydrolase [Pseudoalteromonas peptidolytica]|uniref:Putative hydrolase of the HAD superfamily n=1 Tax=Pseudoalteromonas peptidolytica F12-50-A1 TaxID=1315280 RepID=A0A8I0MX79_9GAMM|nr:HAD family phosphatase [Pseudoalteromonas peptidolytica]MBE0347007.1 putative hydrolase of the HAD superfamily [Pseudoalteromonas peptidolytica F12-50-A1]NLR14061.1 HAD family phosphatase [Pseudoalteromonas peptidolytica]GEK11961.1 haloacid dehalogenase [Pseudoalteromonas peptidolytica]
MAICRIKHVIFDVGNVFVRWSPEEIIRLTFGSECDVVGLSKQLFHSETWFAINRGELSEAQTKQAFIQHCRLTSEQAEELFFYIKESLIPLYGTLSLMQRLKAAGYSAYALTDNVHEIVSHLKARHTFWQYFDGEIISAELGCMKPGKAIFTHLLEHYQLAAGDCVFLDDVLANVEGAKQVGLHGIQFFNAAQAERQLRELGLIF